MSFVILDRGVEGTLEILQRTDFAKCLVGPLQSLQQFFLGRSASEHLYQARFCFDEFSDLLVNVLGKVYDAILLSEVLNHVTPDGPNGVGVEAQFALRIEFQCGLGEPNETRRREFHDLLPILAVAFGLEDAEAEVRQDELVQGTGRCGRQLAIAQLAGLDGFAQGQFCILLQQCVAVSLGHQGTQDVVGRLSAWAALGREHFGQVVRSRSREFGVHRERGGFWFLWNNKRRMGLYYRGPKTPFLRG